MEASLLQKSPHCTGSASLGVCTVLLSSSISLSPIDAIYTLSDRIAISVDIYISILFLFSASILHCVPVGGESKCGIFFFKLGSTICIFDQLVRLGTCIDAIHHIVNQLPCSAFFDSQTVAGSKTTSGKCSHGTDSDGF
jgi:hypothetical protein